MSYHEDRAQKDPDDHDEDVDEAKDEDEDVDKDEEPSADALAFCELCGASENDEDDELLRCEECGRLHCSACREYDDEGTPYCTDCADEIVGE